MFYKLILLFTLILFPISVFAANPNNKFGIHLAQPYPETIREAADLINSNGGKWGYVTVVIQENDRDKNKWQGIFDQMRELNLIPIIRLATSAEGENWRRPEKQDVKGWVDFLDSLNWVVKNRYVILFNEPNHGSEWGGEVDPKNYASVVFELAKSLKEKNPDFFVMISGFDASAPSWMPGMEDEETFLKNMLVGNGNEARIGNDFRQTSPKNDTGLVTDKRLTVFDYIDGWASHSYPNPGFTGSPYATGRGTVRTYEWELGLLGRLGINKELPVFITETGWKHNRDQISIRQLADKYQNLSTTVTANYFKIAFEEVWNQDDRVRAVTPFVLDYQSDPFLEFSWKLPNSSDFYQQYFIVQSLTKIKGEPEQREKGWINYRLPTDLVVQSTYHFNVKLNNLGQAVWDKDSGYQLNQYSVKSVESVEFLFDDLKNINPFEEKDVYFTLKTNEDLGKKKIKFILQKNDKNILKSEDWNFNILPLPALKFATNFFPWGKGKGDDYEIQIFDVDDRLVFKKKGLLVRQGTGQLKDIQNIALDELYRVVILKPYYLPRQNFVVFKKDNNKIKFKSLLPFDFNNDGAFNLKDFLKLLGR